MKKNGIIEANIYLFASHNIEQQYRRPFVILFLLCDCGVLLLEWVFVENIYKSSPCNDPWC